MPRHPALVALATLVVLVPAAFAGGQKVTLTLDWTPNPDHVGFYDARDTGLFARAGLDVAIRAPSDPTAPLKLVGVGESDLAVSYEQELFFAAAKRLPVVAVAAVGAVFGEWAGSSSGLGFVILQAQPALETARIFAAVVILSALALALYALVTFAERVLVPWQPEARNA